MKIFQLKKNALLLNASYFRCSPETAVPPQLNQLVIENMLRLPGLSADTLLKAIQGNAFDHVSAIYNLLVDRLEPTMSALPTIQNIPGDYMPDGAHQLEKVRRLVEILALRHDLSFSVARAHKYIYIYKHTRARRA